MPIVRSPEQVVFEDCLAIYDADTNKLGQGSVKAKFFVRRSIDGRVEDALGTPLVAMDLAYNDHAVLQDRPHGEVTGMFRIIAQRDLRTHIDELAEGIKTAFNGTIYRSGTDTDYRPGAMTTGDRHAVVRLTDTLVEYAIPFRVSIVRQAASSPDAAELPGLDSVLARLTYTPGSGGVAVMTGVVEDLAWSVGGGAIDMTPETAPDNDVMVPGALGGSFQLRCKVTASTSASSGTPNPRIPDGVTATLLIYKNGTSGQSLSQSVFIENVQYSAPRDGWQMVTYRLRRTGASTETLA